MLLDLLDAYNEVLELGVPEDEDEVIERYASKDNILVTVGSWEDGAFYITVEDNGNIVHDWDNVDNTEDIKRIFVFLQKRYG